MDTHSWSLPPAPPTDDDPAPPPPAGPDVTEPANPPSPPFLPRWEGRAWRVPHLSRGVTVVVAAALLGVVVGGLGVAGLRTGGERAATSPTSSRPVANQPAGPGAGAGAGAPPMAGPGLDVKAILAKVEPAVVDIETEGVRAVGEGTGIVFASDGFILTNAHVVSGASRITVTAGQRALPARLVGTDEAHDVAVLRVETGDGAALTVAELGRSADVAVGDDVVAIGNALGLRGDPSVTRGIISALGRSIGPLTGMIQTDAAINPGNSGGPLVNSRGQVIGINTAVANGDRAQNIGFAIPIDTGRTIAARLADGQPPAPTAFLGVTTADAAGGYPGAVVADVAPGSPAAAAGLAAGDRIVAVDGTPVPGAAELRGLIQAHQPGETVSLRVVRGGREVTLEAKLVTQPATN